jgi:S-formylglutathione hydrolase FrmB
MFQTAKTVFAAALIVASSAGGVRPLAAQDAISQGRVVEGLQFQSQILGKAVKYAVYLPPDYETSKRRYPVVYLLHGYTDDESGWVQFGEIQFAADRGIASREIPPLIVAMPDGGVSWYINDYQNKVCYEDMFVQEFIPQIDANYRTRPDRQFRGVAGLSMGGYGTLVYALRHSDLFSACAAFSAGIWRDDDVVGMKQDIWDRLIGPVFGPGLTGSKRLTQHFREHNPLDLAKTLSEDSLKKVRYYIDCGDDDFLFEGNVALSVILHERKIPHEFRIRDGSHTWDYWRTGIVEGLKFIGEGFRR